MQLTKKQKAELWLVLTTLIWGGTFAIIQVGLNDASPFLFLSIRFFICFLVLTIFFPKIYKDIDKALLKKGIILGILMFGGYGLQFLGLKYTTVAKSSLITYSFVLLIPFLQYFVRKRMPHIGNIIGLIIVSVGMIILNNPGHTTFNIGDLVTFGSAFVYAFYVIGLDAINSNKTLLLTSIQFLVTAVLGIISSFYFEDAYLNPTTDLALCLFFLSIPAGVIALFLQTNFQKETSPVKACIIYALEPVFAIILGFVMLHQTLSSSETIGVAIILSGVLISEAWGFVQTKFFTKTIKS
ncbi:MAG: DMT family transporter [Alphaproteobacteria bacterium]